MTNAAVETVDPLDVSRAELYAQHAWEEPFRYLREHAPVYRCEASKFGPYWSISTYQPIVDIEARPEIFSSSHKYGGSITIADRPPGKRFPNFINMDAPEHTPQRMTVAPAFVPGELRRMGVDIRTRTAQILDGLPWGEAFDWVDRVSVELTTQMLAILFDFPWEDRRKLPFWSDVAGNIEAFADPAAQEERLKQLADMGAYFQRLWDERANGEPAPDLLSRMIHSEAMGSMTMTEFIGALTLLIIGGNDTTRNTMTAMAYAFDKFPEERAKLEADPSLTANAFMEIVRWQTPLAHMRRTCIADTAVEGQMIRAGDKVILWYVSANRDESVFPDAARLDITRESARRTLSFGYGVHRCVGARLAELQVVILMEEMAKRRMRVKVLAEPTRVAQSFVNGYESMTVELERY